MPRKVTQPSIYHSRHRWFQPLTQSLTQFIFNFTLIRVLGSCDSLAKVWDIRTGKCTMTLRGHESDINSVILFPDGKVIQEVSKWHDNILNSSYYEHLLISFFLYQVIYFLILSPHSSFSIEYQNHFRFSLSSKTFILILSLSFHFYISFSALCMSYSMFSGFWNWVRWFHLPLFWHQIMRWSVRVQEWYGGWWVDWCCVT